jgi:hypothetical protein
MRALRRIRALGTFVSSFDKLRARPACRGAPIETRRGIVTMFRMRDRKNNQGFGAAAALEGGRRAGRTREESKPCRSIEQK